jgi:hypothetical protein
MASSSMASSEALDETYRQLIDINQKMMQSGHYEVAFHALEAALHCAEDLEDEQRLTAIQQAAEQQRDLIDAEAPEHRMSSQTALKRGGQNLYNILIRLANVPISQLKHDQRQQELGLPRLK